MFRPNDCSIEALKIYFVEFQRIFQRIVNLLIMRLFGTLFFYHSSLNTCKKEYHIFFPFAIIIFYSSYTNAMHLLENFHQIEVVEEFFIDI